MQNLQAVIEKAFNYRGDVTLLLQDGRTLEGYIFNRDSQQQKVELFLAESDTPVSVSYNEIQEISFTGPDTAAGKSWEEWKAKKHSHWIAALIGIVLYIVTNWV